MTCSKCGGLMLPIVIDGDEGRPERAFDCVNCGCIIDAVILSNRRCGPSHIKTLTNAAHRPVVVHQ